MEVRFEDLHIETSVYAASGRNVPNVLNAFRDILEYAFLKVWKTSSCPPPHYDAASLAVPEIQQ